MLTSILKRIDNGVFRAIERAYNGEAPEPFASNTLENEGVGIARSTTTRATSRRRSSTDRGAAPGPHRWAR
jgi:basic membrane lipoprotein Med (substrate-binding protein (PBP1-ABC) superfamily)